MASKAHTTGDSGNRAKTLLNEKEQAFQLSISWRGLQEARKKRLVPHVRIGRRVLYNPSDVARALERLTVKEVR